MKWLNFWIQKKRSIALLWSLTQKHQPFYWANWLNILIVMRSIKNMSIRVLCIMLVVFLWVWSFYLLCHCESKNYLKRVNRIIHWKYIWEMKVKLIFKAIEPEGNKYSLCTKSGSKIVSTHSALDSSIFQ